MISGGSPDPDRPSVSFVAIVGRLVELPAPWRGHYVRAGSIDSIRTRPWDEDGTTTVEVRSSTVAWSHRLPDAEAADLVAVLLRIGNGTA